MQLRPGAVSLGHGVGVVGVVLAQPLVQPRQRVEAHERLVVREHVALLGVEQEHQPEDHCEERAVDIIGPIGKRLAQQLPPPTRRARPGSPAGAHTVHGALARRAALIPRSGRRGSTEAAQRDAGCAGASSRRDSLSSSRIAVRIGLPALCTISAMRKSSQPELSPRGAEISRSARPLKRRPAGTPRLAQKPLHLAVRSGVEGSPISSRPDQELPGRRAVLRVTFTDCEIGAQDLALVRQQPPRAPAGLAPRPHRHSPSGRSSSRAQSARRPRNRRSPVLAHARARGPLVDALREQPLTGGVMTVEDSSAADKRRRGEDEAGRAARSRAIRGAQRCWDPGECSWHQFVSGHRYTSPTGSVRFALDLIEVGDATRFLTRGHGQIGRAAAPTSACCSPSDGARHRRTRA